MTEMPADVAATVAWLLSSGSPLLDFQGGPEAPFGDEVRLYGRLGGTRIRIVRARGQWALDILLPGSDETFPLDLVLDVRAGRTDWEGAFDPDRPIRLPKQLPDGVSWVEQLPPTLAWLAASRDIERRLEEAKERRAAAMRGLIESQVAGLDPDEVRQRRDESVRNYYRQQHAKRHRKNRD